MWAYPRVHAAHARRVRWLGRATRRCRAPHALLEMPSKALHRSHDDAAPRDAGIKATDPRVHWTVTDGQLRNPMGPVALFDKSFLQSLSVDESVWFAHFFSPVVTPLFYVETLADLEKSREGRTPEQEVGIIAEKFPDASASPCSHHMSIGLNELVAGNEVPFDGRIPRPGGRTVQRGDKIGVVFEQSMEEAAFSRWQQGKFMDVERGIAKQWREMLNQIDLADIARRLREIGVDAKTCRSLDDALQLSKAVVSGREKHFERMALLLAVLQVPRQYHRSSVERWSLEGYPPLDTYVPYCAHLLTVELFFEFALAAHKIGTSRPSNRVDIAYLNYLPFSNFFVSSDDLHRKCGPLFLRHDQHFVWGPDLKSDLAQINAHFLATTSDQERALGLSSFAHAPPKREGSLVRSLRAEFMGSGYDDRPPVAIPKAGDPGLTELVREIDEWDKADLAPGEWTDYEDERVESMTIKRSVRKKKGSWYQLDKNLTNKDP